ncbi:MFS transporter [Pullulanibacillus camelliae]|uniref:MFS transporter n=1 Tax=Pullulanibacillus camelliae TaxID=1707096 RepID=A0A8J3E083_9BACL|nr:MFS transporter [Pullulanibacillus camelliae]GGE53208.1 MFS transporter [Pullulanibacillus camelliae]
MKAYFRPAQIWVLFLVFSGTLVNAVDRSSLSEANTFIQRDLHLSLGTMGIILSSFGWTYLLFNIPAGFLSDKVGTKKVYGIAGVIWSLASALTGFARGFGLLFTSRLMVGIGEAANFPAATKIISEYFEEKKRGTATGIYLAGLRLGYALTPSIMIGLMVWMGTQAHPDWRIAFIITGICSLIWVVLWFFTFNEKKLQKVSNAPVEKNDRRVFGQLLKQRNTWAIIFIKFFQDYVYYLYLTWMPSYLITERHMNLGHVAFYATLPWIGGMLAQPLVGILCDYLIRKGLDVNKVKKTMLVIAQLIAVVVVAAAFVQSVTVAAWLLVIAMIAESASTAILWTIPQDLAPKGTSGSLGGIMNTAGAVASIASPAITGFVAQYFGFAAALTLCGCTMVFAILSVLLFLTKIKPMVLNDTGSPDIDDHIAQN